MATKVKAIIDGPLLVSGKITLEDAKGKKKNFDEKEEVRLCRCGASQDKPYCDGSHKNIGFKADK